MYDTGRPTAGDLDQKKKALPQTNYIYIFRGLAYGNLVDDAEGRIHRSTALTSKSAPSQSGITEKLEIKLYPYIQRGM